MGGEIIGKVIAKNFQVLQVSKVECPATGEQVRASTFDTTPHNKNSALLVAPSLALLLASYFM